LTGNRGSCAAHRSSIAAAPSRLYCSDPQTNASARKMKLIPYQDIGVQAKPAFSHCRQPVGVVPDDVPAFVAPHRDGVPGSGYILNSLVIPLSSALMSRLPRRTLPGHPRFNRIMSCDLIFRESHLFAEPNLLCLAHFLFIAPFVDFINISFVRAGRSHAVQGAERSGLRD
jgi:hypothetical protein